MQNALMARKKATTDEQTASAQDRHKPGFLVRLPAAYEKPLAVMVQRNPGSDRTEFVRQAVKEFLERQELWPPK